jgi:hypothetical protein
MPSLTIEERLYPMIPATRDAVKGLSLMVKSSGVTVLIASVSLYCFEKPLNDLKRHFEYEKPPSQPRKAEAGVGVLSPCIGPIGLDSSSNPIASGTAGSD